LKQHFVVLHKKSRFFELRKCVIVVIIHLSFARYCTFNASFRD
jgi:hypothetical protein